MAKEILLYNEITRYTAGNFITALDENKGSDIVIRMNTYGGYPEDSYGMIAKMNEFPKNIKIKVDGRAFSTGFSFLASAKEVEALDVSQFMFHRAAYPSELEADATFFTDDRKTRLNEINATMRKTIEKKINVKAFEKLTGKTLDDIFSLDSRIDVFMNASQAKEIGLVDKIVSINASVIEEVKAAASAGGQEMPFTVVVKEHLNNNKMENTKEVEQAKINAANEERARISAWLEFSEVDAEAVKKGIESGEVLSAAKASEFTAKMVKATALKALEATAVGGVQTQPVAGEQSEDAKALATWKEQLDKSVKQYN